MDEGGKEIVRVALMGVSENDRMFLPLKTQNEIQPIRIRRLGMWILLPTIKMTHPSADNVRKHTNKMESVCIFVFLVYFSLLTTCECASIQRLDLTLASPSRAGSHRALSLQYNKVSHIPMQSYVTGYTGRSTPS